MRQNLFVRTSQNCDFVDRTRFMLPIMSLTAAAAIVSFLATSSLVGDQGHRWNLAACIIGVVTQVGTKQKKHLRIPASVLFQRKSERERDEVP